MVKITADVVRVKVTKIKEDVEKEKAKAVAKAKAKAVEDVVKAKAQEDEDKAKEMAEVKAKEMVVDKAMVKDKDKGVIPIPLLETTLVGVLPRVEIPLDPPHALRLESKKLARRELPMGRVLNIRPERDPG